MLKKSVFISFLLLLAGFNAFSYEVYKTSSVFYPASMIEKARNNANKYQWAQEIRDEIVKNAQPFLKYSDDELWDMMFGNTLKRSWMVWSNGHCPSCGKDVPMYTWKIDALNLPWKVKCPFCGDIFPKNDFYEYYLSGIDKKGVFDPAKADRKLLYNKEHPALSDSLRFFGVDDGGGYYDGKDRWWFIGTYLIYGQWKQLVQGGVKKLASAYVVTGDPIYAHKAAILIDRTADLYPTFDFGREGVMYEGKAFLGCVSTWHDACEETRELALAYDQIFDAIKNDKELVSFLSGKAAKYGLINRKKSFEDIQWNIENGILRDAIVNRQKINSNFPRTEIAIAEIHSVLDLPKADVALRAVMDNFVTRTVMVDGVTGEKGLTAYSRYVINGFADFLELYSRIRPDFMQDVYSRFPDMEKTFRFHVDTWFNGEYYPNSGDGGSLSTKNENYIGMLISKKPGTGPSMFSFLERMYKLTGESLYLKIAYIENGRTTENLPRDIFADDPETFQKEVSSLIKNEGDDINVGSINKEQWCLAMMRSGKGGDARAFWIDYDSGGGHSHMDALNVGLFAKGLDLMSEFGYPPVQYGGWESPKSLWYSMTAAHNTVVIDGKNQKSANPPIKGRTELWADGELLKTIKVSAPDVNDTGQYERTLTMIDISSKDSYLLDIFRVTGGHDHAKFMHTTYSDITTGGLNLGPCEDFGNGVQAKNYRKDGSAKPGWFADWTVQDRKGYIKDGKKIHIRYTDLTPGTEVISMDEWLSVPSFNETGDDWIPSLIICRKSEGKELSSSFVGIIEPYDTVSKIRNIKRLDITTKKGEKYPDNNVALEVALSDGNTDILIFPDTENPHNYYPSFAENLMIAEKTNRIETDGQICFLRKAEDGKVSNAVLCGGTFIKCGKFKLNLKKRVDLFEIALKDGKLNVIKGDLKDIKLISGN